MRLYLSSLVMLLSVMVCGAQQLKFGHFDSESFMKELPEVKQLQADIEKKQSATEDQIVILKKEAEKILESFKAKADKATEEEKKQAFTEYQEMQQRIETFVQTAQQEMQRMYQERLQPIQQKVMRNLQELGAEQGFLYIFESTGGLTAYKSSQSIDVAPLLKAKMQK